MTMTGKFIYVSATRADGSFAQRGMTKESTALDVFQNFRDAGEGGRAVFVVLSSHDARLRARPAAAGFFEVEIIARAARNRALFGLLPAKPEIALRSATFSASDVEQVIHALYTLGAGPFRTLVEQEIAG